MAEFWVNLAWELTSTIFSRSCSHNGIKIARLASVLLVKLGVRHTHDILKRVVVTEEATFSCCKKLFRAQIRSTVYREPGRCPLREAKRRLPQTQNSRSAIFLGGVKRVGCSRGLILWGWRFTGSQISERVAFSLRYPLSYLSCLGPRACLGPWARGGDTFAWDGRSCVSRITTVTTRSGRGYYEKRQGVPDQSA